MQNAEYSVRVKRVKGQKGVEAFPKKGYRDKGQKGKGQRVKGKR
jgi:hypothetical protein